MGVKYGDIARGVGVLSCQARNDLLNLALLLLGGDEPNRNWVRFSLRAVHSKDSGGRCS